MSSLPSPPGPLLTAHTLRWRRRLPRVALVLLVAGPLTALAIAETFLESTDCTATAPCRYPLDSALFQLAPIAEALAFAGILVALLLPRAGVWVAAVAATLLGWSAGGDSSFPGLWRAALVLFVAVGVLDMAGRRRQFDETAAWPGQQQPYPLPPELTVPGRMARDEDTRTLAAVVLGVGAAASAAMLAWHLYATAAVHEFEAHAIHTEAAVTQVDDEQFTITVQVAGHSAELEPLASYSVGDAVPVLVDAADPGHIVLAAEPEDPSWRIGVAAVVLAVTLALGTRLWSRGSRRARLMARGGRAVRARLGRQDGEFLIATADDEQFARPLAVVSGLMPSAVVLALPHAALEHDEESDEEPDLPSVNSLSDTELAHWADQEINHLDDEDDDYDDDGEQYGYVPTVPLAAAGGSLMTVIGLRRDGDPVAVLGDDGGMWVSEGGIRDPWGWRRLWRRATRDGRHGRGVRRSLDRPRALDRPGALGSGAHEAREPAPRDRLVSLAVRVVTPVAPALAYALALAAYPAAAWVLDGSSGFGDLIPIVLGGSTVAQGLTFLAWMPRPPLVRRRGGLLHRGRWLEEFIPAWRVSAVTAGSSSLVLRLCEPDDALALPPECTVPLAQGLTSRISPDQAASTVTDWLHAGEPATADATSGMATPAKLRGWRRPALSLVPGVVFMAGLLLAWAGPHVGL